MLLMFLTPLLVAIGAAAADFQPPQSLPIDTYEKYFGNTNGFCVVKTPEPEDSERKSEPSTLGRVHPFARAQSSCESIGGNWISQISKDLWEDEIEKQHHRVGHWWGRRNRRRTAAVGVDSNDDGTDRYVWLIELADGVQLTSTQRGDLSVLLDAPLEAFINKHDAEGGSFLFVYTKAEAVTALFESYPSLVASAAPLPEALKISAELRVGSQPLEGSSSSSDALVRLSLEVFLAPGTVSSLSAAKGVATDLTAELQAAWDESASGVAMPCCFEAMNDEMIVLNAELPRPLVLEVAKAAAADPRVIHVTAQPQFETLNKYGGPNLQSGSPAAAAPGGVAATPFWDNGITGTGQVVGVADSGLDSSSCFFYDANAKVTSPNGGPLQQGQTFENTAARKVVQYVAFADASEGQDGGHGTHVSGSVAGSTTNAEMAAWGGQAQDAKIAFFDIGVAGERFLTVPNNLYTILEPAYDVGARIHTNSWGSPANTYTSSAYYFDKFSYENQDFVVLVAAGNDGSASANTDGSVGSPATGKNVISVAAGVQHAAFWAGEGIQCTDCSFDDMAHFSSKGPAYDGRFKPELTAPGKLIGSASSSATGAQTCDILLNQGTSMATPLLAGTAALVRQYFTDGFYPSGKKGGPDSFVPMGALVKAVLIHSAQDIQGGEYCQSQQQCGNGAQIQPAPAKDQGFGRTQIGNVLHFEVKETLFIDGKCPSDGPCTQQANGQWHNMPTVDVGGTKEYKFGVTGEATKFRVTLVWHDPTSQGLLGNARALVNNLDLIVTNNNGVTILPLQANGATGTDTVNNVEVVHSEFAAGAGAGDWTVTVKGETMTGPQPFAIVVTADGFSSTPDGGQSGSLNGLGLGLLAGPFAGATVAVIFILGASIACCWLIRDGPTVSFVSSAFLRSLQLAVLLVETIAISGKDLSDWRGEGAFALSIFGLLIAVGYTLVFVLTVVGNARADGIATAGWFQMLVVGSDIIFVGLWAIFAAGLASCPCVDAAVVLVAFVILVFYCVATVLYFVGRSGKGDSGAKQSVEDGYTNMRGRSAPKTRPKTKRKAPPTKKKKKRKAPPTKKKPGQLKKNMKVKAKYKYDATQEDELGFKKGAILKILNVQADGWIFGMHTATSQKGVFPGNYVAAV